MPRVDPVRKSRMMIPTSYSSGPLLKPKAAYYISKHMDLGCRALRAVLGYLGFRI